MSLTERLAVFLRQRPNQWVDGRELAAVAGAYAWRSRVADVRRPPFNLTVVNRIRIVRGTDGQRAFRISEYAFRPGSHEGNGLVHG